MDLTPYVDNVRNELAATAEIDSEASAERIAASLESALRLALLEALAAAANEITSELAPGSVEVRLRGRDPSFVVTLPQAEDNGTATNSAASAQALLNADDGPVVRTNLRLPEWLKLQIEEAAAQDKLSINAWLVQAAATKLDRSFSNDRNGKRTSRDDRVTGWMR